jgi:hypothetical protein
MPVETPKASFTAGIAGMNRWIDSGPMKESATEVSSAFSYCGTKRKFRKSLLSEFDGVFCGETEKKIFVTSVRFPHSGGRGLRSRWKFLAVEIGDLLLGRP